MPTTPLQDLAKQEQVAADAALARAKQRKSDAATALVKAGGDLATAKAALAAKDAEAATLRQQLGRIAAPPDGDALLADLRKAIVALRMLQGALLDAQETVATLTAEIARADGDIAQASSRRALADALAREAQGKADQLDAWKGKLADDGLKTLRVDATAEKSTDRYKKAAAKKQVVPTKLVDLAKQRATLLWGRGDDDRDLASAIDAKLAAARAVVAGPAAGTKAARAAYEQAETALRDYVLHGVERLARARQVLEDIAQGPDVTDAEKQALDDLEVAGAAAADAEKARNEKRGAVDDATQALALATVEALAKDPDEDPAADAGVQQAQKDLTDAQKELATAQDDFAKTEDADHLTQRQKLAAWQAALPDSAWKMVAAFLQVDRWLDDLAALDPATLIADLDAAEKALVTAQTAEGTATRKVAALEAEAAEVAAHRQAVAQSGAVVWQSTVRGDR
jgi:hypothetical protein